MKSRAVPGTIRRVAIDRHSSQRYAFVPAVVRPLPRWLRRLLLGLLLLLLLLFAFVACDEAEKPASLATSALYGPRQVSGPVCLEEAVDVSGSMLPYTAQREHAERELFAFARRELEPTDLFSASYFAGNGVVALPPTPMSALQSVPTLPATVDQSSTLLAPGVDALVQSRGGADCAARILVVITDGQIFDEDEDLRTALTTASYTRMYAVIPSDSGWGRPSELTGGIRNAFQVHHFHSGGLSGRAASVFDDAKPLDVVFGAILADITGQELGRTDVQATPTS